MDRFLEFTGNHTLLVTALMVSFFLVIFSELRRKASGMINIEASDAVKLINNNAVVIDLRSSEAYGRGHIVSARNLAADDVTIALVRANGASVPLRDNLLAPMRYLSDLVGQQS